MVGGTKKLANGFDFTMTSHELWNYNQLGLIPGPNETDHDFLNRAEYCLKLKDELPKILGETNQNIDPTQFENAFFNIKESYDILPKWVPIFFTNHKLSFWHGGCAWIYQLTETTPTASFLQLRRNFLNRSKYLFYSRDELIAHELSHVGRMMFEEPKFEEFLAYRLSPSWFRRWFGPIIQSSTESMIFLLSLVMVLILDAYFFLSGNLLSLQMIMWLKVIPLALFVSGCFRVILRHYCFNRCLKKLTQILQNDEKKALAVAYRLTDKEIISFSKSSLDTIKQHIHKNGATSPRWKVISLYF